MNVTTLTLAEGRALGYAEYGDPDGQPVLAFLGAASRRFYENPVKAYQKFHHSLPEGDAQVVRELGPRYLKPAFMRDTYDELYRQGLAGPVQDDLILTRSWGFEPGQCQAPTLLWHGEADTQTPVRRGRALAEAIPGCRAHFLPNEGQLIYLKHWPAILAEMNTDC